MKVLITGANGFIGNYLTRALLRQGHHVLATGKGKSRLNHNAPNAAYAEMDFTDPYSIDGVFEKFRPELVLHAGAMGRPDECELNQAQAYMVNVEGTVHLLVNAEEYDSRFIFLSTDFVFDGERGMYKEDDQRNPVNYYGRTKVEAEDAVMEYAHPWAIIRTVLVYGQPPAGGKNMLTMAEEKLRNKQEIRIVGDQVRTPTYVEDLVEGISLIIKKEKSGIYHVSGKDRLTPYDMCVKMARLKNLDESLVIKVDGSTFREPARRPKITGFNIEKARRELGYEPISFDEGMRR